MKEILADLYEAADQVPKKDRAAEAQKLIDTSRASRPRGKTGPQPLSELIVLVLARLGVGLESKPSGEKDPT